METIELKVGNSVTLKFKSLASAGYMWDFEISKSGVIHITPEGSTRAADMPAGQSLDEVFDIAGYAPGKANVTFRQRRSWQKDAPLIVKEYSVEVQ